MYAASSVCAPFALIAVVAALSACSGPPEAKAGACESLTAFAGVPNVTVDKAEMLPAGFVPPGEKRAAAQPFCRVQATARPSSDSDIKFEMWLPVASHWNGRFLANGGGGNSGAIMYSRLTEGLARGYASLSTDNGHVAKGGNIHEQSWAVGHPQKVIDFGYRAQTVTAVAGKQITRAFYGSPASKSYWIGCSQGGGKGLMQAQRYPENFDGIVAGAPVFDWTGSMFSPAWVSVKGMRDPAQGVARAKLPMIHRAVLAACDAQDGLVDGLLQEPGKCKFDPATIACSPGKNDDACLTPGEVTAMKRFWAPITGNDGRPVFPGSPYGAELTSEWLGRTEPGESSWAWFWLGPMFEDPSYDIVRKLNVDDPSDFLLAKQKLGPTYDAVNPDLSQFAARRGKLILWHGLQDQLTTPLRTKQYVDEVNETMGPQRTSSFMRSYFPPGVNHCRGGAGPIPDEYDLLSKVVNWVEKDQAPAAVTAVHRNVAGEIDRTMPVCPYPQIARYDGKGSPNVASSFICRMPSK